MRGWLRPGARWFALILLLLVSPWPAAAQPGRLDTSRHGHRGQAAIDALGVRLPVVAARHHTTPAALRQQFLDDPTLWVDHDDQLMFLDEFLPTRPVSGDSQVAEGPFPYGDTFQLHSLPGATKVVLLDFDGHATTGTPWNSSYGDPIVSAPFDLDGNPGSWSAGELDMIQAIWQRVVEDFIAYGVDVTTADPGLEGLRKTSSGDGSYGQRVVISPTNWYSTNAGGVAYVGAFNWDSDTPCYAFTDQLANGEKYIAEAVSHEAGHTLGLSHDGATQGVTYYEGHGSWAPIMGVGYYREVTQWSKGEYANATNTQDDLAIMTGYGFGLRPDDHGDTASLATGLTMDSPTSASGQGIVGTRLDRDSFSFVTGAGAIALNISPAPPSPNLDVLAELYNAAGTLVASSNPAGLGASFNLSVAAGTYFLVVDGVGSGSPSTGYSDYASLGQYSISGTLVDAGPVDPPAAPTGLGAAAASASRIDLSWTDPGLTETGFRIERSLDGASWLPRVTLGANVTSFADTGLAATTEYSYRVLAFNSGGDSDWSNIASATTLSPPPFSDQLANGEMPVAGTQSGSYADTQANDAAVESLREVVSGGRPSTRYSYLEHKWTFDVASGFGVTFHANAWAPANGDGDVFRFAYSTDNLSYVDMFTLSASTDGSYQSFALPANTDGTVYVRVTDSNRSGGQVGLDSVFIDHLYIRTDNLPPPTPAAPTNLTATVVAADQVDLAWVDHAANESGFRLERATEGGAWSLLATTGPDVAGFSDSTAAPATDYAYRVRAFNGAGDSGWSNMATTTTPAASLLHVGDLDGTGSPAAAGKWNASVTVSVHDALEVPVSGVVVSGTWSGGTSGTATCTTSASGTCTLTKSALKSSVASVVFTVNGLARAGYLYGAGANHDPDGDSGGTTLTVTKP